MADEAFKNEIAGLVSEITARSQEVGPEQCAEEYWEKAQADLDALCARNQGDI